MSHPSRDEVTVRAQFYILAAGGLEGTRLLLASETPQGHAIGNHSGHLGRWYMAHVQGVISNVHFFTDPRKTMFDFERDAQGVYVRRRFTFSRQFLVENDLPNIAGWLANPAPWDSTHGSGVLSFVYLALASPLGRYLAPEAQRRCLMGEYIPGTPYGQAPTGPIWQHARNIIFHPVETARFISSFGAGRFLARHRRVPGFFVYRRNNVYPFQYHSEHFPNARSAVALASEQDELGVPRLDIQIAFSEADVQGVIKAHEMFDRYLREQSCGRLEYIYDDLEEAIRPHTGGGFHQVGTTRMARLPEDGVLDGDLFVHHMSNLAVASSSAFVTSGQANSTFMIVAFTLRLVDHIRGRLRSGLI